MIIKINYNNFMKGRKRNGKKNLQKRSHGGNMVDNRLSDHQF